MATNFPTTLDTNVELGGIFANALPVVDPITNIDATKRNNLNDAMFAVQAKLGTTGSLVPTSVDWGLLGAGGTPNQGVQFAASGNIYPGAIADSGIFHHAATGAPAWHLGGDPLLTFYDVVTDAIYGLQTAYDHVATIVTAGAVDLAVSGTENVSFTFGGATKQLIVTNPAYLGNGTPDVDGVAFVTMVPADDALACLHARIIDGVPKSDCSAIFAVNQTTAAAAGNYYAVIAQNVCASVAAGTSYGYDFLAESPSVGGGPGTLQSYGFYSHPSHTYGFYSASAIASGFFSNSDEYGFRASNATQSAFHCDAGNGINLRMNRATNYDIFSEQTKVTFEFYDVAADVFLLEATPLATTGGRTAATGMLALNFPTETHAVAQLITAWSTAVGDGSDQLGGVAYKTTLTSGPTAGTVGPLTVAGILTGYEAAHTTNKDDSGTAVHQAFNAEFTFTTSGAPAVADEGPTAYGLRVNMPETYIAGPTYHLNEVGDAFNRWAINVVAGESKLRRTYMEGPTSLNKAVLHVNQTNTTLACVALEGVSSAAKDKNFSTGAIGGFAYAGMYQITIIDPTGGGLAAGTYWVPLYT